MIGLEPTFCEYLDNLLDVFQECHRVLKSSGMGIRTTEIVQILPIAEGGKYTTKYRLKCGNAALTSGDWKYNLKSVEALLSAELYPDRATSDYLDEMRKADCETVKRWLDGGNQYMKHSTRNALKRILDGAL